MIFLYKIFGKWDPTEVEVRDLGIKRYVSLAPVIVPHSSGKHARQQFNKSEISIVERLANNLMRTEINSGKKQLTLRAVEEAFDIVNKKTKQNPIQILVDAIANAGPREEVVRLKVRWDIRAKSSRHCTPEACGHCSALHQHGNQKRSL